MNKNLLSKILILMAMISGFTPVDAANKAPKKDQRTLDEVLRGAMDARRTVIKEDDRDSKQGATWDEEDSTPEQDQKPEPTKQEGRVKDAVMVGKEAMAARAKAIKHLFVDRKPLETPGKEAPKKAASKKDEQQEQKPVARKDEEKSGNVVPMGRTKFKDMQAALLQSKRLGSTSSEQKPQVERKDDVVQKPKEEVEVPETKPVVVVQNPKPVLMQGKDYCKNQLIRMLKLAPQFFSEVDMITAVGVAQKSLEALNDEFLKYVMNEFNRARLMIEILSFRHSLNDGCENCFLVKNGLTAEEKGQMQIQVLVDLIKQSGALSLVENRLPKRFFVENNGFCVKIFGIEKYSMHPDFVWWHNIIADEDFYDQNTYQVNRAFYLIDQCTDLLALVKDCKDTAAFALHKDELERAITELRWLWIIVDMKKYQGMCSDQKISLQHYHTSEIFIEAIKTCMKQVQDLINV